MNALAQKKKAVLTFGGGTALLLFLVAAHLLQSSQDMPFHLVWEALLNNGDTLQHNIVQSIYLPRIVIGIIAGAALAAAGVIFQTLTKNPLASPSTLGVHSGAYFFVVLGTVAGPAWLNDNGFILAFTGGTFAAVLVFFLAGGHNATPVRMALAGMVLTLMFTSFTSTLQIFFEYETAGLFLWGNGTLVQQDWNGVLFALPWVALTALLVLWLSKKMDVLLLGEDQAKTLGENVRLVQVFMFFAAVGLTALVVSVVGPVAFIGLIAPHLMKLAGYQLHGLLIPASMLWGANILIGADVIGRLLDPSLTELPVGSITALIGAPWLVWLLLRNRSRFASNGKKDSLSPGNLSVNVPYPVILLGSLLLLIIAFFTGLAGGSNGFQFVSTWNALLTEESSGQSFIIFDLRLGRILSAMFAGILLALSGLLFQGILRNPLADPSIIGVTSGAGVGALTVMFILSGFSAAWIPIGAIIGSFITVAILLFFSWKTQFQPAVLALMGIGISAAGGAITQILITRSNMNAASALTWLSGSTYATGFSELQQFLVWPVILLIPISIILMNKLNILSLGDQTAIGLGVKTMSVRLLAAILATFSSAMAVAAVGTIGFIGLVAPHLARLFIGHDHRKVLPVALLLGAALLVFADTAGRMILAPKEIPSGLVAAVIGAPFFLWLMGRAPKSK
ncbi:iron complex transport system permease protein [Alteribacillus persepolensis]|uniref:Iron complex transport system permease protein n=1 Tax=Alteribacillus persepolensis TaxID=568899 RepID=A0A1G8C7G8_9BACI|nr:iron ABC transporter permease [Alteribacillus persepolensis]SDH41253.1 iron complex transport system permease protein [Alteribacillus persepolensis]